MRRRDGVQVPNAKSADVPEQKIVRYLLSSTHSAGRSKAAFFGKHGFTAARWDVLANALRMHARSNAATAVEQTRYGTRYVVDGPLDAPDGTRLNVRSVWFITHGTTQARFTTAHPLKRMVE